VGKSKKGFIEFPLGLFAVLACFPVTYICSKGYGTLLPPPAHLPTRPVGVGSMGLQEFSVETIVTILGFLDVGDILNLRYVCRKRSTI
jgi:hypothetical protein